MLMLYVKYSLYIGAEKVEVEVLCDRRKEIGTGNEKRIDYYEP